ncbi:DNA mismatch repair protein MutL [Paenibacillus sp. P1XP2]|nr:DNA mismatch repair protein MutL [Paenibacillus sp. P1XP2]
MKTIQTELGHVSDYMYRIALSHPEIAITLRHNENQLLKTLGNGDLLQVIAAIYGTQAAKAMLPVQAENLDFELSGFVSLPEWTRSNRNGVSTIVNGRYIRNYGLNQAIQRAYHTLLPINRYPLAVLEIKMHPSLVDVNVHPAKLEVRFSKEQELYPFIEESIRRVLRQEVLIPQAVKQNIGGKNSGSFIQEQFHFSNRSAPVPLADQKEEAAAALEAGPGPVSAVPENRPGPEPMIANDSQAPVQKLQERPAAGSGGSYGSASQDAWTAGNGMVRETRPASYREWAAPSQQRVSPSSNPGLASRLLEASADAPADIPPFPELTLIGQHHGTYLIAQNDQGLYLIDQHAAHERVNYEYYYEKFGQPADASQELLLPITLEFTPSEAEQLKDKLQWFEQVGVYLEHFGGQTFRVRSLPYWFPKGEEKSLIEEMAEWVLGERKIDLAKLREKSSILCSCKASIKANQKLTEDEAKTLIERLGACRQPYTCPHGRPIVVSFSTYDLEKLFKRVM